MGGCIMRLSIIKSKNASSFYVIKDFTEKNKRTTKVVEKLGTLKELEEKLNGQDPIEWAKKYVAELNKKEKEALEPEIIAKFSHSKLMPMNKQVLFNGGYLFLQDIYHDLKIHKICKTISERHNFNFDLDSILSRLIYTRVLYPSSKLSSFTSSHKFFEQPNFDIHQVYRALEVIAAESDFIESEIYKNSLNVVDRNTGILYYDCTNYFFETEHAEGVKQYGVSKEHRPNPIVQMGLFMDGNGLPLAFSINDGNQNEQISLKPLEKRIMKDFELSKFVVCTDAGLGSRENREFNDMGQRAFVVTQSLKKIKSHIKKWALDPSGWYLKGNSELINLNDIDDNSTNKNIYYKERWINENGLEQKLIVSYSPKYKAYQQTIRSGQIIRAEKMVDKPSAANRKKPTDPKRFIKSNYCTDEGEVADNEIMYIDNKVIENEEQYDGFYAVCTNLDEDIDTIININKRRWEIEESFRILKSEFKARPVYLSRDDRIKAHFTTCFLSLLLYRILERKLNQDFSTTEIISTIKDMNFMELRGEGYVPVYTRTEITDTLHRAFNFRTDTEIVGTKQIKKIIKETKK